jgi:hypothetical protein
MNMKTMVHLSLSFLFLYSLPIVSFSSLLHTSAVVIIMIGESVVSLSLCYLLTLSSLCCSQLHQAKIVNIFFTQSIDALSLHPPSGAGFFSI